MGAMNYSVEINGIHVDAIYSEKTVNELFIPLLRKLTQLQEKKGKRVLVFLAAPPGSGKSTLCSFLEKLSLETDGVTKLQAIGMDGFHRRQEYLQTHTTIRDGKEVKMVDIKGAPITFDLDKLTNAIEQVASDKDCYWPTYDRHLHNPIEDAIHITGNIVLLEGNYLLLEEDGWKDLRKYADYTISLSADENMLRDRLIDRKMKSGNDLETATHFVDYSDMVNVRLCLEKTAGADLRLKVDDGGEIIESL